MKYFDVHVFYSRDNGSSYFIKANLPDDHNEEEVISEAVNQGVLEPDDMEYVDYVAEITEEEYNEATNKGEGYEKEE